jgi:uncharacterized alkaline shock family protein YloU
MSDSHTITEPAGTITLSPAVLAQVVRRTAEQADGARVRGRRGPAVKVDRGRARVSLELVVRYGTVLPDVAGDVQRRVAEGLREICGLEPDGIDVAVEELDA